MNKIVLTGLGLGAFLFGCINPHQEVVQDSTKVIAEITIDPPTFARTQETKDLWLTPTKVDMLLDMESMDGLMKRSSAPMMEDTVVGSMRISSNLGEGMSMSKYMGGNWMKMTPDSLEHHMTVLLSNGGMTMDDSVRPVPILYSTVTVVVKSGAVVVDSAVLMPIHGAMGSMYGANMAIPLDMTTYTIEVRASVPVQSLRDSANQGRIQSPMNASFTAMLETAPASGHKLGSQVLADSVMVTLSSDLPQTLWIWDAATMKPVQTAAAAGATVFVGVMLDDLKSKGSGEPIGHAAVRCMLRNEDGHDSTAVKSLGPVHGSDGFYYGANMPVPAMESAGGHD